MSDQSNSNNENSARLDRVEQALEKLAESSRTTSENLDKLNELSLKNEFNLAAYRKASDERLARIEELQHRTQLHLNHLSQLAGIFGDRTLEIEEKLKRVKDTL